MEDSMNGFLKSALVGAGLLGLSAGIASAAPAYLSQNTNLRAGPGTHFYSQGVIPGGSTVNVTGCNSGWCAASHGPLQGYISQSLLHFGSPVVRAPQRAYRHVQRPMPRHYRAQPYPHRHAWHNHRPAPRSGVGIWFGF
jgi:uncharacterized protein YraI